MFVESRGVRSNVDRLRGAASRATNTRCVRESLRRALTLSAESSGGVVRRASLLLDGCVRRTGGASGVCGLPPITVPVLCAWLTSRAVCCHQTRVDSRSRVAGWPLWARRTSARCTAVVSGMRATVRRPMRLQRRRAARGGWAGLPEAALSFSSLFAMLRCACFVYRCAV